MARGFGGVGDAAPPRQPAWKQKTPRQAGFSASSPLFKRPDWRIHNDAAPASSVAEDSRRERVVCDERIFAPRLCEKLAVGKQVRTLWHIDGKHRDWFAAVGDKLDGKFSAVLISVRNDVRRAAESGFKRQARFRLGGG
jgi:hypothetical protein